MQNVGPHDFGREIADALADLRLWVLTLIGWLARHVPSRGLRLLLQQSIRDARKDVRLLVFAKVLMRLRRRDADHRHPFAQPAAISAPPGFRLRRRRTQTLKLVARGVRLRSLRDLRHAIENIDRIVTRALRRLPTTILTHQLVAVRIPARVSASCAIAPAAEAADTS